VVISIEIFSEMFPRIGACAASAFHAYASAVDASHVAKETYANQIHMAKQQTSEARGGLLGLESSPGSKPTSILALYEHGLSCAFSSRLQSA